MKNIIVVDKEFFNLYQPTFLQKISLAYLSSNTKKVGIYQLLYLSGKYKISWPIYLQTEQGQSISGGSTDP